MKIKTYLGAACASVLFAVAGCGGANVLDTQDGQVVPMGEGNIPIGRAQGQQLGECMVHMEMSDGRTFDTITKKQVIYAPFVPKGLTSVTVTPGNRLYAPYTLGYLAGDEQQWVFNIFPAFRLSTYALKDLQINLHSGQLFRVGDTFKLRIRPIGEKMEKIRANVVINGGIGSVDENDELLFTQPGFGQVQIELLGVKKVIGVKVMP